MHPTHQATGDSAGKARQARVNRAHADGWQSNPGVFVHQLDRNSHNVEAFVAGLRR